MTQLETTLKDAQEALVGVDALVETLSREASSTGGEARASLEEMQGTFEEAQVALATLEQTLRAADDTRIEASRSLSELGEAMRVMRNLAEYIQTHPEALVLGKSGAKEEN